jgi:hypothetical protein
MDIEKPKLEEPKTTRVVVDSAAMDIEDSKDASEQKSDPREVSRDETEPEATAEVQRDLPPAHFQGKPVPDDVSKTLLSGIKNIRKELCGRSLGSDAHQILSKYIAAMMARVLDAGSQAAGPKAAYTATHFFQGLQKALPPYLAHTTALLCKEALENSQAGKPEEKCQISFVVSRKFQAVYLHDHAVVTPLVQLAMRVAMQYWTVTLMQLSMREAVTDNQKIMNLPHVASAIHKKAELSLLFC